MVQSDLRDWSNNPDNFKDKKIEGICNPKK